MAYGRNDGVWLLTLIHRNHCCSVLTSQIIYSGESQLPYCEDTQAPHGEDPMARSWSFPVTCRTTVPAMGMSHLGREHSNTNQSLGWLQAWSVSWTATLWTTLNQNFPANLLPDSWPAEPIWDNWCSLLFWTTYTEATFQFCCHSADS